ncbi:MAG: hypothetical protein MUF30_00605 [Burkholderiales bacterium]|jgi:hypothetical protein|nr:hypothetical protein [Burkholderiales bacterium]
MRAALAAALCSSVPAFADGFYVGGGFGRSRLEVENVVAQGGAAAYSAEGNGNAWKLYGGWKSPILFGVEGGYYDFGKVDAGGGAGTVASSSIKMTAFGGFGTLTLGIPLTPVEFIGKLGLVRWDGKVDATGSGAFSGVVVRQDANEWSPAGGIGVQAGLLGLKFRAEYERFQTDSDGFKPVNLLTLSVNYTF